MREMRYLQVYRYIRDLIDTGQLGAGERLPSVRDCCRERKVSRTTVETAYQMLEADGYILAKPRSGYYATGMKSQAAPELEKKEERAILFDFSAQAVDRDSFDFTAWRRYLKSALRQDERMLSYGEPQGEKDLREAVCHYLATIRNVICSPEQVVIGAGTQSLLGLVAPILRRRLEDGRRTVSFPTREMVQGRSVFEDYGFEIRTKDPDSAVIYVSPSSMNRRGDVMPYERRRDLVRRAAAQGSFLIEDDYECEFMYGSRPLPALFTLAGGHGIVYLGTFSRLLLPSIRLSFMVLPVELVECYRERSGRYNQTASKSEQIALCQWLRDGHFVTGIRRLRKLYQAKTEELGRLLEKTVGSRYPVETRRLCVTARVGNTVTAERLAGLARRRGIRLDGIVTGKQEGEVWLVFSSLSMQEERMREAMPLVGEIFLGFQDGPGMADDGTLAAGRTVKGGK